MLPLLLKVTPRLCYPLNYFASSFRKQQTLGPLQLRCHAVLRNSFHPQAIGDEVLLLYSLCLRHLALTMTKQCAPGTFVTPPCGRQATSTVPSTHRNNSPCKTERSDRSNGQISGCTSSRILNNKAESDRQYRNSNGSGSYSYTTALSTLRLSLPTFLVLFLTLFASGAHSVQLAQRNGLLYDSNPAPEPLLPHLVARGKSSTSDLLSPTQATFTLIPSNAIAAATSNPTGASQTNLPQPFDTSLGNNFTSASCPNFFRSFLNDKDFRQCYPFSLLLQV